MNRNVYEQQKDMRIQSELIPKCPKCGKPLTMNLRSDDKFVEDDRMTLGKAFIEIGKKYGMTIRPCAEGKALAPYGADCSGCMTVSTYETALHSNLIVPKTGKNQRNGECACLLGSDIGAYDTCGHLCRYCYANTDPSLVRENMRRHDPKSPFLIGTSMPDDMIHQAVQKSWIDRQLRLDLF